MKNLILKKWVLLTAIFFIILGNTFAANYVVSGAGDTRCNGLYVETGTQNGKPYYIYSNEGRNYAIGWDMWGSRWQLGEEMMPGEIMDSYTNTSASNECPTTGWTGWNNPVPTVEMEGRAISYSAALFTENVANDGSISNSIVIAYNGYGGDAFTGILNDNFVNDGKITASNVPAGLTASIIKTAGNQLTFSLTGNATNHATNDRVYNITLVFQNNAFVQGNASGVSKYTKSDFGIFYNITFSGGAGTEADPYLVSNIGDLRVLSENWGSDNLWNKHFKQAANISFQASDFQNGGNFYNGGEGWIPIGNATTNFTGTYDGDGHTISNLFIKRPLSNEDQGLFGNVSGAVAKIENLGVLNLDVTGSNQVGGLVGNVNSGMVNNSFITGNVNGISNIGGLVGNAKNLNISKSCSSGNVIGTGNGIGGLVGAAYIPSISNSYSTVNVTGVNYVGGIIGIIGNYSGSYTIRNSYSTGKVTGTGSYGGMAGKIETGAVGSITNSFWDIETSEQSTSAGTVTGKTTSQMKTQSTFTNWDFVAETTNGTNDYWDIDVSGTLNNNGYPYLSGLTANMAWNGSASTEWSNIANWTGSLVLPTSTKNITIPSGTTNPAIVNFILSSPAVCKNLTIDAGSGLTIPLGKALTINGTLTNNGGTSSLVINSDATGTGSLIATNGTDGSGTALVERYMPELEWHIISSPAGGQTVSDFIGDNTGIPYIPASGLFPDRYGMMDYDPVSNNWNSYFTDATATAEGSIGIGKGYMVRVMDVAYNLRFKGLINPTFTTTVGTGWNCIGNPFTSAIRINTAAGSDNFMTVNSGLFDDNNKALYFWNQTKSGGAGYDVVNLADDGATYAQVGQGFFMKAKAAGDASFTTAMQTHQTAAPFKAATVPYPRIRLIAAANNKTVSTDIKFIEGTQKGLDPGYDAGLFTTDKSFSIYTKLVEDNGIQFQLQCLPPNQYDKLVIPIGLDSKAAGEIVFTVQTVQLAQDCKVILEDKLTYTFTDLSKGSYKATVAANTATAERFFLHTCDIVSGVEDQVLPEKLTAYAIGNKEIRVIGEVGDGAIATLVNGLGQMVLTKKLGAGSLNIIGLPNLTSGLYMLNINDKGSPQTIKVMIRK